MPFYNIQNTGPGDNLGDIYELNIDSLLSVYSKLIECTYFFKN